MSSPTLPADEHRTLADLVRELGDIPPDRIRLRPPPGAAEADTLDGGDVLPGFALPVRYLFAHLDRHG